MANITLFAQAIGKLPKENLRKIIREEKNGQAQQGLLLCWLKHIAKYKWGLANLVVSLRLNTFTKIELDKWLDEPFTPPPEQVGEE